MKNLMIISMMLFLLPSCSKKEGPTLINKLIANVGSRLLSKTLECSNPDKVRESFLLYIAKEKRLNLGSVIPCRAIMTNLLPKLLKNGLIPGQWECKASKIDEAFDKLANKICSKL